MLQPSFSLGHNHRRILETLRLYGPMPRIEIADLTDLQPATLTRLSQDLIDWGMLEDVDFESVAQPRSAAKRKTRLLRVNSDRLRMAGIAFTVDRVAVSLSSLTGEVIAERMVETEMRDPGAVAAMTADIVQELLEGAGLDRQQLLAAGVSLPINLTDNERRFFTPSEWPLWRGSKPRQIFEAALGVPTWVENDGHAAALAEAYFGVGAQMENFCLIYFAYGLGGGNILHRRLFRGSLGNAAAFGSHFPQDIPRPSGRDLMRYLEEMGESHRSLFDLPETLGTDTRIDGWLHRAASQLAPLVHHAQMLLDCEAVVLGGLLPRSVLEALAEHLRILVSEPPSDTQILVSQIDREHFHLGAASIPQYEVTAPHKYRGRAVKGI
ncbi:ROK family protein [Pleomorphomonas sp. NRK KF1]|uniref:ROK family protein n=1 Tax=Pleomorphomonas sp. NRK KF1 TaxID=2943000 RepID=UPI002043ED98|nr:ROK family protein [Pleomorphomonas sp. NRK KF1]MCM5555724.1 ROK family protein [Pleomorphomonas sp. NRK KF1]